MLSTKRIAELAVLHRFGNMTLEDRQEFDELVASLSEDERQKFFATLNEENTLDGLKKMLEADESFDKNLVVFLNRKTRSKMAAKTHSWRKISYAAAAVILAAVAGLYWYSAKNKPGSKEQAAVITSNDLPPGTDKAILVLADGSNINLSDAANGNIGKQGDVSIVKSADGQVSYTAGTANGSNAFNTIRTPRGGKFSVLLPDGTKAWLNAASSLHFPVEFLGINREVSMEGEVYFEVAKDPHKPFIVHSSASNTIEVLGTHFNVMAYREEAATTTTLFEGSVKVRGSNNSVIIKPGQAAISKDGALSIDNNADLDMAIGWTKGMFVFNKADIKTVMNALSRWYDVEVKYDLNSNLLDKRFEVSVDRNTSLNKILNALHASGFEFKRDGKTVTVSAQ